MSATATLPAVARKRTLWGENIRRLIDVADTTATAVAEKAAMTTGQFSDIVNNPAQNPTVDTLQRVADALGVPLAALFDTDVGRTREEPRAPAAPSRDPNLAETLRDLLTTALTGALVALGRADESFDEQSASPRVERAEDGGVLPQARRKVG